MTALEKIKLIDDVAKELQKRFTYRDIDAFFIAYGIPTGHIPSYNSKYVYVKEVLPTIDEEVIIQIANELDIKHDFLSKSNNFKDNSISFWKPGHFKLFISHLSSFKQTVTILKIDLEKYGISAFVAHEDIEPTKEWQEEIEKGLFSMDALCAVLTPGFKESNWTDQEIGIAIGRGILVVPIRRELDPYGFIGKYQGFQGVGKNIGEVAEAIFLTLAKHSKTRNRIINSLTDLFLLSNKKSDALNRIGSLKKIPNLPEERIITLKNGIVQNLILKNNDIISAFNQLLNIYQVEPINIKDFEKTAEVNTDDLPF